MTVKDEKVDKKEKPLKKEKKEKKDKVDKKEKKDKKVDKVDAEKKEKKEKVNKKEDVEKALIDSTKKRKAEDEIEIDLESSIPLSKKQKRLLRRGKISLDELNAKYNIDPASISQFNKEQKDKEGDGDKKEDVNKFSVWIGNMSFDTTRDDLIKFVVGKTKELEDEESRIPEADILRVKLPLASNGGKQIKNKGFCYMDFKTETQMKSAIALSENQLNGRNLLIKDSKSYVGRPDKNDLVSMSKNPPSRILFCGNLSYTTTEELLKAHFQHCGEIIKIRMATFEDSGKCKGFAFVDFKTEEGATNALKDKACRKIAMRPLRMEYGEDRSKRQVRRRPEDEKKPAFDLPPDNYQQERAPQQEERRERPAARTFSNNRGHRPGQMASNNRLKSSVALSSAQRGSAAIVPSQGKKVKFD
ncbi:Nop13p KNAG_0F01320 [Huiozyma naganishii CBS 8797]|uniref:RRM domain-containing protein n=1 Tax=Huiozyma naganishii (strain ATCC MYA-139 / BCRC 22969 / CBS 8797 / KCTC 17520 / NBRC 10181 / NCYC 3082 / Yp74L-3) TaxID=1071383 RepID=J7R7F3_HUIN7|nr:hypothetical protein KNAG_0F01320 [Kazachstania naganishii CBS 8797]CCK70800.1 hypothetical protein KNAG_0F01320 [Kazachstania naganishii CBS 8797]